MLKPLWEVIQDKSSLWVRWCKVNLLRGWNLWSAPIPGNCSWSSRNILHLRKTAMPLLVYDVKDGTSFSFWRGPWLNGKPIIDLFGQRAIYDSGIPTDATVSAVTRDLQWCWPVLSSYLMELRSLSQSVHLQQGKDNIYWRNRENPSVLAQHGMQSKTISQRYPGMS
ncbi:hypothetical protein CFOL_v3_33137 [Cephalotus follicularis]|uniref:Zf-RVT domain-containing protein n=1 Tax=Cephalotus follicularis TaxID=3775 RepID=A0A1Q3DBN7_CEPFO|nr:hypothetical protein CFOL_v3_33137 [Cephalotus follicularis]